MDDLKAHWGKYIKGAVAGAVLVLILGFAVGTLTTSGSAKQMAVSAANDRDILYCVANARKLVETGAFGAPSSGQERTDLAKASFASLLPEETFRNTTVRDCTRAFPREF